MSERDDWYRPVETTDAQDESPPQSDGVARAGADSPSPRRPSPTRWDREYWSADASLAPPAGR